MTTEGYFFPAANNKKKQSPITSLVVRNNNASVDPKFPVPFERPCFFFPIVFFFLYFFWSFACLLSVREAENRVVGHRSDRWSMHRT